MTRAYSLIVTLSILICLLLAATNASAAGATSEGAGLPGIDAEDRFPAGCVDCHVKLPDRDVKIGPLLEKRNHPVIDIESVADDCRVCHSQDGEAETLSNLLHRAHYGRGADSHFIHQFGGLCLHCHAIDLESGEVRIKQGPPNW